MRKYLLHLCAGLVALGIGFFNPSPLAAQEGDAWVVGHWQGTLVAGSQKLQIIYHIATGDDGALTGTMDVPTQGAAGIALSSVAIDGSKLSITFAVPGGGRYEGESNQAGDRIKGTFSQGSNSFPLELARAEADAGPPPKPQEPQAPFPYDSEEVVFANRAAKIDLAGTITTPKGEGPFPGVVLISGAGPHDRNGSMMGHKPFLVLADHLTRQGIAVLRFDDRGTAQSGGDFASAMPEDLASDALAGVEFLSRRPSVALVGVAGHSDGAQVALLAAARADRVAYLVLLAGASLPAVETIEAQARAIGEASGLPAPMVDLSQRVQAELAAIVLDESDPQLAVRRMKAVAQAELEKLAPGMRQMGVQMVSQMIQEFNRPQTRFMLSHDPRATVEKLTIPMLALYGSKDVIVPAVTNAPEMSAALKRGGNPNATVETLAGLNHFFQEAKIGGPAESGQLEQTFSPKALEFISQWISERFGGPATGPR